MRSWNFGNFLRNPGRRKFSQRFAGDFFVSRKLWLYYIIFFDNIGKFFFDRLLFMMNFLLE